MSDYCEICGAPIRNDQRIIKHRGMVFHDDCLHDIENWEVEDWKFTE